MTQPPRKLLEELFSAHGKSLQRFLSRKLGNADEAEEIAQEALLRIHRLTSEQPDGLDNARAFLFQVASNMAVDQLRRRNLHQRYAQEEGSRNLDPATLEDEGSSQSPEEIVAAREQLAAIYHAIETMPSNWREAFLLHRVRGLSYQAIAREMGVSVSSVEKYILEALKHCRKDLVG
jgi:RNA polymerase sigma-70 factor (ECF subfamily)